MQTWTCDALPSAPAFLPISAPDVRVLRAAARAWWFFPHGTPIPTVSISAMVICCSALWMMLSLEFGP